MKKQVNAYWLDSLRADIMAALCDKTKFNIGSYDIGIPANSIALAFDEWNFDNIEIGMKNKDKKFVLTGTSICDHYFDDLLELKFLLIWVCFDCIGYNIVEREQADLICHDLIVKFLAECDEQ